MKIVIELFFIFITQGTSIKYFTIILGISFNTLCWRSNI